MAGLASCWPCTRPRAPITVISKWASWPSKKAILLNQFEKARSGDFMLINRRSFTAASGMALAGSALAQFRVEISGVGATQVPIAIAHFRDEDRTTQSLSTVIRADLERAGVFRGVDTNALLDEMAQPQWSEWRARAADALVGGSVTRLADGRFEVRFKLWDVVKGRELGGLSNTVAPTDLRLAAHH